MRLPALIVAAVAALALGAPVAQADDVVKVRIVARDGVFTPPNLEVLAGKRIKIEIANEGRTPMEFESLPLKIEKVLGPGATSSVVINPLRPGEYPFYDEFHPDTSKGRIVAK